MNTFVTLLKESVIVQATLTFMIWGVICYLYATSQPIPIELLTAGTTILGFYFGSKAQLWINTKGVK